MRYTLRKLMTVSCVGVMPGTMRFQLLQEYKRVIRFLYSFPAPQARKNGIGSAPGGGAATEKALWGVSARRRRAENFGILDLQNHQNLMIFLKLIFREGGGWGGPPPTNLFLA